MQCASSITTKFIKLLEDNFCSKVNTAEALFQVLQRESRIEEHLTEVSSLQLLCQHPPCLT